MVEVTKELIEKGRTGSGGWTRRQLEILGETWPPESGWKNRAIGREITERQQAQFLEIKQMQTAKLKKKKGKEPRTLPRKDQVQCVLRMASRGMHDSAFVDDLRAVQKYFEEIYGRL